MIKAKNHTVICFQQLDSISDHFHLSSGSETVVEIMEGLGATAPPPIQHDSEILLLILLLNSNFTQKCYDKLGKFSALVPNQKDLPLISKTM